MSNHYEISDDLKSLFLQRLEESVTQGDSIQYIKSRKSITTIKNSEGEIIKTTETVSEERNTTISKTTPQAVSILDRALSTEQAINLLMNLGYVVFDPTAPQEEREKPSGLSQEAYEVIYSDILGISRDELPKQFPKAYENFPDPQ